MVGRDSKVHDFASSLYFVDYYKIWSSGRDLVIQIPEEFVRLNFLD